MPNGAYAKGGRAVFEAIADIGALRETGGMLPGDYIMRSVVPKLRKMGKIDDSPPRPLRHWSVILGKDTEFFKRYLVGDEKKTAASTDLWVHLLDELNRDGWYWPRLVNKELVFGSRYIPEERPKKPGDWELIAGAAGFDDEDFIHEE